MKSSYKNRYKLSISEHLTINEIMQLLDCGRSYALDIRKKAIEYCLLNNVDIYCRSVPTEAVLKIAKKDIKYYFDKMILESKMIKEC